MKKLRISGFISMMLIIMLLLTSCSSAGNKFWDLSEKYSKIEELEQKGSIKLNFEMGEMSISCESPISSIVINKDGKINSDMSMNLKYVIKTGEENLTMNIPLEMKIRESKIQIAKSTIDSFVKEVSKFSGEEMAKAFGLDELEKFEYIEIDMDELANMGGNTAFMISFADQQKYNKILREMFKNYNDISIKESGNKIILEINNENREAVLENLSKYLKANKDKIVELTGSQDSLSIFDAISMDNINNISTNFTMEIEEDSKGSLSTEMKLAILVEGFSVDMEVKTVAKELKGAKLNDFKGEAYSINKLMEAMTPSGGSYGEELIIDYDKRKTSHNYAYNGFDGKEEGMLEIKNIDGRTYAPLRKIAELMGEDVKWDPKLKKAYVLGYAEDVEMTGIIIKDRTYVKLRDFEKLSYDVNWVSTANGGIISIIN